jgi:glycosyltransferase involved in cell wall biosynthesis
LVFIGNYSYPPNLSAAKNISRLSKILDRKFVIAGPNLPSGFDLGCVKNLGVVKDTSEIFNGAAALVYPEKFGTGVKTKVLESWSFMVPVIGFRNAFTNLQCHAESGAIMIDTLSDINKVATPDRLASCSKGIVEQYERYSEKNVYSTFTRMLE